MRNDSSIVYHYNGCTRRSLSTIASVRSSETIFSSSFCACFHLFRLSVTYLTTYSSLHSLWYYLCKSYSQFIILSMFLRISTFLNFPIFSILAFPIFCITIFPILRDFADSCHSKMYILFYRDVFFSIFYRGLKFHQDSKSSLFLLPTCYGILILKGR